MAETNVKISLDLFNQTLDLLDNLNPHTVSNCDKAVISDYEAVLSAFHKKRAALDLRQAYSDIVFAKDEEQRFNARMRYLRQKRQINDYY
jgi:predicted mannosyl-3-phosphoglycerate phosphatase (HAD superfamily)